MIASNSVRVDRQPARMFYVVFKSTVTIIRIRGVGVSVFAMLSLFGTPYSGVR